MKEKKIERDIIFYVWGFALFGVIVLLAASIIFKVENIWKLPLSFILGVCTNLMCFTLTIKVVDFVLREDVKHTKGIFIALNVVKLIMYSIIVILAVLVDSLDPFSAFAGMLSVKFMIYFRHLVIEPIRNKRLKRKNTIEQKDGENIG